MWLELLHGPLDGQQPILEARDFRIVTHDAELTLALHALEVDAPADRVPEELLAALLEGEQETPLPDRCPAVEKLGHGERFPRAGGPRDQSDGIAEETAAAHVVEFLVPARHAHVRRFLLQLNRRQRNDHQAAIGNDGEWKF